MCKEQKVIEERNEKNAFCKEAENKDGYILECDKRFKEDEKGVCKSKFLYFSLQRNNLSCFFF